MLGPNRRAADRKTRPKGARDNGSVPRQRPGNTIPASASKRQSLPVRARNARTPASQLSDPLSSAAAPVGAFTAASIMAVQPLTRKLQSLTFLFTLAQ